MKLSKETFEEMEPTLELTRIEEITLKRALQICREARRLTTSCIDDDSPWADAELALDAVVDD